MNVKLIAGAAMNWGGKRLRVGDGFEASEADALDLIAVGHASRDVEVDQEMAAKPEVPPPVAKAIEQAPSYSTRVLVENPRKKKKHGSYKRRDMRADK